MFGLGNPGRYYADTRHNVGAWVVRRLGRRWRIRLWRRRYNAACGRGKVRGRPTWLFQPRTYMNRSGYAVAEAVEGLNLDHARILIVSDDIDLPPGKIRLREKGSAGGHKGLQSIIDELGTQDFARLRLGVGKPPAGEEAADHVLSPFAAGERELIEEALARAAACAETWLLEGPSQAMTAFNP
ncbi:MAG: aminoacyl-tRNA hydrolase [Candidatus Coatesbacteria bacterium]|nr:MAG: aminoacyl-tRNA hydrolase [Candidatus Coatesbacteria bacterium]